MVKWSKSLGSQNLAQFNFLYVYPSSFTAYVLSSTFMD